MNTSLLIATCDRSLLLARNLERLNELTLPDQIVVVDDGGSDSSCRDVCEAARSELGLLVDYIRTENPGSTTPCHARNVGLRQCLNEHIVVTEPEIYFESDVIRELEGTRGGGFNSTVSNHLSEDAVLHEAIALHQDSEDGTFTEAPGFYVHSFMKGWLEEVGGWDEGFPGPWGWDDIDLYKRLEYNGHPRYGLAQLKIKHMWHPSRVEPAVENEAYARAKELPRDLVANKGLDWGTIRS